MHEFELINKYFSKLTNKSKKKVVGLEGYGIKITKQEIIK